MANDKPILRAQACRFRRLGLDKNPQDWEPGIALLKSFGVSDVDVIIDIDGNPVSSKRLYDYNLLQLRTDGYIAIESYDYAGKSTSNIG